MRPAIALPLLLCAASALPAAQQAEDVDFARDIEPILSGRCVECHGADKQKAGLRLDRRADALAGAWGGEEPVILPGDAAASPLVRRVRGEGDEDRMPPKGDPLDEREIALLERWIDAGAPWPEGADAADEARRHWAYVAPVRPEPPAVRDAAWCRNAVDRFVLARLEAEGLAPAPEAERATLLRRVTLDLTGLPPEPEALRAFLDDGRPDAYERAVDALLDTSAHAEHRARRWLDLARYADTNGYEKDESRTNWRWRDWVIGAYERDLPFDEFTRLQLAGDLVGRDLDDLIATGFQRNTMTNKEGGTDPEEFRVAAVVDRVNTLGSVWLGTTLACAQCHNHKYDPFSQKEYFELFAFFDSTADTGDSLEPQVRAAPPEQVAELERLRNAVATLESELAAPWPAERPAYEAWERAARALVAAPPAFAPLELVAGTSRNGARLTQDADGQILVDGPLPEHDAYTLEFAAPAGSLTALHLEALREDGVGPGRAEHGNIVLTDVTVAAGSASAARPARAAASWSQPDFDVALAVDDDPHSGWALGRGGEMQSAEAWFVPAAPLVAGAGERVRVVLSFDSQHTRHVLGRFRLSASTDPRAALWSAMPVAVRMSLQGDGARRFRNIEGLAEDWWRSNESERGRALVARLGALRTERDAAEARVPMALVLHELDEPRETHVMRRGNFLERGERVQRDVPSALSPWPEGAPRDRLGLAQWLCDPANPLVARVTVNRLWDSVFGRPLVTTVDDLGTRGEAPSHPALLDWLAVELVEGGWDSEALLRTLVTSATYRQAARATPELLERDPQNVLLARASRPRLEAEVLRDCALAAAGLLDRTVGGPSVFPPQPPGIWASTYSDESWQESQGPARWRRGMYTFLKRTAPYPSHLLFDGPSRELTCMRRERSNTPLQALALLNDPVFVEAAVGLARRVLLAPGDDAARLERAWTLALARAPDAAERALMLELLAAERARFAVDREAAAQLTTSAVPRPIEGPDTAELAAWTVLANVILNLDEFVTRG